LRANMMSNGLHIPDGCDEETIPLRRISESVTYMGVLRSVRV
jgi:hypothetical protein